MKQLILFAVVFMLFQLLFEYLRGTVLTGGVATGIFATTIVATALYAIIIRWSHRRRGRKK